MCHAIGGAECHGERPESWRLPPRYHVRTCRGCSASIRRPVAVKANVVFVLLSRAEPIGRLSTSYALAPSQIAEPIEQEFAHITENVAYFLPCSSRWLFAASSAWWWEWR